MLENHSVFKVPGRNLKVVINPEGFRFGQESLEIVSFIPDKHYKRCADLGCGDGRMIITAVRRYGARAVGIEIDPLRYLWCQFLVSVLGLRDRVKIIFGNFFSQDLSDADVITCYLLQDTNEKLEGKLKQELRPGTRVVSHDFTFPGLSKVRRS